MSYRASFDRSRLALPPARRWAILACMDARLTVEDATGLLTGDAHIIRNAGGLVTEDAVRSRIIPTVRAFAAERDHEPAVARPPKAGPA